jgi:peptide/nickel transport system ATP-binding protein/oligopeptide transport system ATP-binding protein
MAALNPVYTIGQQMSETLRLHLPYTRDAALRRSKALLEQVRIPNAGDILGRYPFTLSGGMRQRVMIAMALSCKPDLVIADEPTTALDVTIQAQILRLLRELREETGAAVIFITHDLSVISETADRVLVMYAGRVCEQAPTRELIRRPLHPYTQGLINSKPKRNTKEKRLRVIPGSVPSLLDKPSGCPFHPRCDRAAQRCSKEFPPLEESESGHFTACWNAAEGSHG